MYQLIPFVLWASLAFEASAFVGACTDVITSSSHTALHAGCDSPATTTSAHAIVDAPDFWVDQVAATVLLQRGLETFRNITSAGVDTNKNVSNVEVQYHEWFERCKLRTLLFWGTFTVAAVAYECWHRRGAEATAVPRDGRWDTMKFWCMMMVVMCHLLGYWAQPENWGGQSVQLHFMMTGFSFVSGYFAAGAVTVRGSKVSMSSTKLKSSARDLLLAQVTVLPLCFMYDLLITGTPHFEKFLTATPLLKHPTYWYLDALFVWTFVAPLITTLRYPVLLAGAFSITQSTDGDAQRGVFFYFVFYVAGFTMSGGGKSAEERSEMRASLEKFLVDARVRVAACLITVLSFSVTITGAPEPLQILFCINRGMSRTLTPWDSGGLFMDAARISTGFVFMFCFFVIIFMLPSSEILSAAGSRTLFVYLLQGPMIPLFKAGINPPQSHPYLICFIFATFLTLVTGSRLMQTLAHHFVQPQWLIDLCTTQPQSDVEKAVETAKGSPSVDAGSKQSSGGSQ